MSFCASVVCKDNYAVTVQKIMPAAVRPGRLADRGDLRSFLYQCAINSHHVAINSHLNREFGLTAAFNCHISIFTNETLPNALWLRNRNPSPIASN